MWIEKLLKLPTKSAILPNVEKTVSVNVLNSYVRWMDLVIRYPEKITINLHQKVQHQWRKSRTKNHNFWAILVFHLYDSMETRRYHTKKQNQRKNLEKKQNHTKFI